ncbi:hypothetical protein pb186bvf_010332 [Paramecium bursaria]
MFPQRFMSKSPMRTQSHTQPIQQYVIVQDPMKQMEELRNLLIEYQRANHSKQQQIEELTITKDGYFKQIKELSDLVNSLKNENQRIVCLLKEKQIEIEQIQLNNKSIIDDFNKQFESTLRMRIDSDIKEIHNRYLREINTLKLKLVEYEQIINSIKQDEEISIKTKTIDELLIQMDSKNNYIDTILLSYCDLDESYHNLQLTHADSLSSIQKRDQYIQQILGECNTIKLSEIRT